MINLKIQNYYQNINGQNKFKFQPFQKIRK